MNIVEPQFRQEAQMAMVVREVDAFVLAAGIVASDKEIVNTFSLNCLIDNCSPSVVESRGRRQDRQHLQTPEVALSFQGSKSLNALSYSNIFAHINKIMNISRRYLDKYIEDSIRLDLIYIFEDFVLQNKRSNKSLRDFIVLISIIAIFLFAFLLS